ncbi:MAG: hypothetical protein JRD94_06765 [Deltaproteobacteria bacterium]|nr:hypothetical protein [Deltaproteobacteria bacterium]
MPTMLLRLRRGAAGGALITVGALLAATPSAGAQTGVSDGQTATTPDSASPTGEEEPSAVSIEYPESKKKPEPGTQQQWPAAVSIEYPESKKKPEPEETGIYSRRVQGKLWLEGFVGPSSYDLDRFGAESAFFQIPDLGFPKVKGPEFGAAFGGAIARQIFFIGAAYRQANYEIDGFEVYKLMKVGLDLQAVITLVPYVHPLIRFGVGYARVFGGVFSEVDLKTNGSYFTLGAGVRVPIVRWVSFVATFDWSYVTIYPKDGGGLNIAGQQLGGTFGLTLHFVGVKK